MSGLTRYELDAQERARKARVLLDLYNAASGNDKDDLLRALVAARPMVDQWRHSIEWWEHIRKQRDAAASAAEERAAQVRDLPDGSGACMAQTADRGRWPRWYPCRKPAKYRVPARMPGGETRLKHVCGAHKNVWLRNEGSLLWQRKEDAR